MKIEIKYPKLANLYSFVSNLSQWNKVACVPQRQKEWIQKTGKLKPQEKANLNTFSKILQQTKINLEPIFLFEEYKKVWPTISRKVSKTESEQIQLIFKIFENRFNKIWSEENKKLKIIAKKFKGQNSQINSRLETIRKLCGLKKQQLPKKIEVRLLLSSNFQEECQGWSFKDKIVLECSGWPLQKIDYLINNIFLHECFHILFKKNQKLFRVLKVMLNTHNKILKKFISKIWSPEIIFEEVLISSFLPEGYLTEKFSKINVQQIAKKELLKQKNDNLTRLRYFAALYFYELAKKYVEENKPLDKFYFEKVIECISTYFNSK